MHEIRPYESDRDRAAVHRVFRDCSWSGSDDDDKRNDIWLIQEHGRTLVGVIDDVPEAVVVTNSGSIRYVDRDLPLAAVSAVVVSRRARRQGLARSATVEALAQEAEAGAAVSLLGIFDQGFYDDLGYGCGRYERWSSIDPATLVVEPSGRLPVRLGFDDFERVHASRRARTRLHGGCNYDHPSVTRGHMKMAKHAVGLGFEDEAGELTHHFWMEPKGEHGPDRVVWMAWRTRSQLFELLGQIKTLSDQLMAVRLSDPPGVQLQDLVRRPFRSWMSRKKGEMAMDTLSHAWWQVRILDLVVAIEAVSVVAPPLRFGLELTDPIEARLADRAGWKGVGGPWTIELGERSEATPGIEPGLPVLKATVNAFSRWWLGVLPASSLAITDRFEADEALIADLDRTLRLPRVELDWPV